ncbi:uncharacterized protein LOC141896623 isoform X4 [Acropora palmata]|uniref:uncharacterized protein LOC141896623 isoform X4 n=1 Tax=Acropora palmata TaxID=6131 RepID=UPI003DA0EE1C
MTELPMSTTKGQFVAVVVIFLFVFISCALLEKSDQHFSRKGSKKCLRNCLRRQEHLNATRLSSCYHDCLNKKNRGAAQHLGLYSKIIHQRTRKALRIPHNNGCPDPSPSQTVDWSPQQKNVSFGKYENASHWYMNVSWTPMNDSQGSWNAIKVSLIVQSSLDSWWDDVNCSVHPKNQTFLQLNLSLYHYQYPNSIFVTIVALPYTNYYSPPLRPFTPPIPSTSRATSRPTTASTSRPTSRPTTASTSPPSSRPTTASTSRPTSRPTTASTSRPPSRPTTGVVKIVAISFGVLAGLVFSLCMFFRYCRSPKPKIDRPPEDFKYAAFIVFSFLDAEFMEKVLHFLETELQLKCCVHFRDFAPGKPFVENMAYSVNNSYKVVVLFSNNFLTSEFAEYEMKLAIHRMVEKRDNSLVVIRIDDVEPARLPSELITKSFIDYNSYLERPFWKQRILEFFKDDIPCDDQTMNNNSICYEHTGRPSYTRLCSTLTTQSQMSYV